MAVTRSPWHVAGQVVAYLLLGVGFVLGLDLGPRWAWVVTTFYGINAGMVWQAYRSATQAPHNVVPFQRTTTTQR